MHRGNHETKNMNKIYGFEGEIKHKYDDTVMNLFTEVFNWLPIASVISNKASDAGMIWHTLLAHPVDITLPIDVHCWYSPIDMIHIIYTSCWYDTSYWDDTDYYSSFPCWYNLFDKPFLLFPSWCRGGVVWRASQIHIRSSRWSQVYSYSISSHIIVPCHCISTYHRYTPTVTTARHYMSLSIFVVHGGLRYTLCPYHSNSSPFTASLGILTLSHLFYLFFHLRHSTNVPDPTAPESAHKVGAVTLSSIEVIHHPYHISYHTY